MHNETVTPNVNQYTPAHHAANGRFPEGVSMSPAAASALHHSTRVLLVQPHGDSREMYSEFLRQNGVSTIAVGDGHDALPAAPDADVIVTGILVPGIDGIDLLSRLRADDRTKHTPIIVLTACDFPADRARAEAAGCDVFLPLPCSPDALLNEVRRLSRMKKPVHGEKARRAAERSGVLLRLNRARAEFDADGDVPKLLNGVLTAAIAATDADFGNIQIVDAADGGLRIAAQHGFDREFLNFFRYVKKDRSACSAALRACRRMVVKDVTQSRLYTEPARQAMLSANARACQSTPIVGSAGRVLGIISTHFRISRRPTRGQLALVDRLAHDVADLLERRRTRLTDAHRPRP